MGIIPARAGFTSQKLCGAVKCEDHPRSRGVYPGPQLSIFDLDGSSPLARGLRLPDYGLHGDVGIIPARAGFTSGPWAGAWRCRDHPRSRGVYPASPSGIVPPSGSSPLARGLLLSFDIVLPAGRIIPARAGFTIVIGLFGRPTGDHPRSRGVYPITDTGAIQEFGSSPLARGLPSHLYHDARQARIIPARAGFTTCGSLESQRTRTLPDPCRLHCRPGARSAGSRQRRRRSERRPPPLDATRPPRVSGPGSGTTPTCAGEWRRRPARSGSRRSGGSAPPRSRG